MTEENLNKETFLAYDYKKNPALDRVGTNSVREERISLRIDPAIHHKF